MTTMMKKDKLIQENSKYSDTEEVWKKMWPRWKMIRGKKEDQINTGDSEMQCCAIILEDESAL